MTGERETGDAYARLTRCLFEQNQFAIRYDLEAMRFALRAMALDRPAPCLVIVGGTNGKGTCCAALHAMCVAAGLRAGLYTSPHLVDFRERMRVDGAPIPTGECVEQGEEVIRRFAGREGAQEGPRPLSYFELTTLIALRWFAARRVDVAILEVGMGGRLDATNALEPDLSVITNVAMDHMEYLGGTPALIAQEKAPIARAGRPVHVHADASHLSELCAAIEPLGAILQISEGGKTAREQNVALAGAAFAELAQRLGVAQERRDVARLHGAATWRWPGRQSVHGKQGRVWLVDGAHNAQSAGESARWLAAELGTRGAASAEAIVGISGPRDPEVVLAPLRSRVSRVIAARASAPKSRDAGEVGAVARSLGFPEVAECGSVADAIHAARAPHVWVGGSLYLVGDWYREMGWTPESLRVIEQN